MGFLQTLQHSLILQKCGGFRDAEEIIVEIIGQSDFMCLCLGEESRQQFGILVGEKVMPLQIVDGDMDVSYLVYEWKSTRVATGISRRTLF